MKFKRFGFALLGVLLVSPAASAGGSFLNQLGRHIGYGISDGYHAPPCSSTPCMTCDADAPIPPQMIPMAQPVDSYSQWNLQPRRQVVAPPQMISQPTPAMRRLPAISATLPAARPPSATIFHPAVQLRVERLPPID